MAHGEHTIPIPGEFRSEASDGIGLSADGVYDYLKKKTQEQVNAEVGGQIEDVNNEINEIKNGSTKSIKTLGEEIDAEVEQRQQTDNSLQEQINDVKGGGTDSIASLKQQINQEVSDRQAAVSAEQEAREQADNSTIETVDSAIAQQNTTISSRFSDQDERMENMQGTINAKQLEIGAVPTDEEPTPGSGNILTSGAIAAAYGHYDENSQFLSVVIDQENKIVEGIQIDGSKLYGGDVHVLGSFFLKDVKYTVISNHPEWIMAIVDAENKIAFGIKKNGKTCADIEGLDEKIDQMTKQLQKIIDQYLKYSGRLDLPKQINLLQDGIYYLYYEQMLSGGFLKDYKIPNSYLPQSDAMNIWRNWTGTIGKTYETITLGNGFGSTIESKELIINIVDKSSSGNLKICVIGDSMTENPKKLLELANLSEKDGLLNLSFLGSRTSTGTDSDGNTRTVMHCGYGGLRIVDFCQSPTLNGKTNIFYDNSRSSENKFSIAKGIEAMGGTPDVIIIDHGANQTTTDWNTVKSCYDQIISDVATYNSLHNVNMRRVICVQPPSGLSDTINLSMKHGKWSRDFGTTKLRNYIDEYDDREAEGIFLLPQYLLVDPYKDYPRTDIPCSTRNTTLREISLDNIHPGINMENHSDSNVYAYGDICTDGNDNGYISLRNNNTAPLSDNKIDWAKTKDDVNAGYWKLADAYFAELKYLASL